jgi:membrane-associated phospholipid phosphatase
MLTTAQRLMNNKDLAINHYSFYQRMAQMIFGWGSVGLVYFSLGWREVDSIILPELWLDKQIAFTPTGIWLYLCFFILIPYTYATVAPQRLLRLRYAMQLCALFSGLVFLLFPSELNYPDIVGDGISVEWLRFLMANDSPQNCLPSLHAALSLTCVISLWEKNKLKKSVIMVLIGIAICISIIQLRRHLSLDVSAGLLVGLLAYSMVTPFKKLLETAKRSVL